MFNHLNSSLVLEIRSTPSFFSITAKDIKVSMFLLQVSWRPVIGGLVLQFIFAYLILRTCFGYQLFNWLGQRVQEFLTHSDYGSWFVFRPKIATTWQSGEGMDDHYFAFRVMFPLLLSPTLGPYSTERGRGWLTLRPS